MSWLIDLFQEFFSITGNSIIDTILFTIIGAIAFSIAFGLVGMIFDSTGHYDSDLMSDTHWFVRIIVFIGLSFIFSLIFKVIQWLFSFKWYVYLIGFIFIIGIIVLVFILKYKASKKKNTANQITKSDEQQTQIEEPEAKPIVINYSRDYCPRCGGRLVKRHGPYGDFYGCENYPTKNCRYTRKFK